MVSHRPVLLWALAAACLALPAAALADANQPPVITAPGTAQAANQNSVLVFSSANGNQISVADPDAGSDDVAFTMHVDDGTLSLASNGGLTFNVGADNTGEMQIVGSLSAINAALDGLTYSPGSFHGTETLLMGADDLGHNGTGGQQSAPGSVTINVNATPVNTVPGTQTIDEDTSVTFSTANGNAISVSDADDTSLQQVTVDGNFGKVKLTNTSGITGLTGNNSGHVSFGGTIANINAALQGVQFTPDGNFDGLSGTATMTITSADTHGASDTDIITVAINALNDAPVNSVSAGIGTYKDVPVVLSAANSNAVSVEDVDGNSLQMDVTLTATHGVLTVAHLINDVTVTAGANGSNTLTLHGGRGNLNATLGSSAGESLTFTPASGYTGTATVAVTSSDLGNTGTGGTKTDSDSFDIRVDAPGEAIYWLSGKLTGVNQSGSLSHAGLDGTGGANLLTGTEFKDIPLGLAIDVIGERVYWALSAQIYSAKLDGTDRRAFYTLPNGFVRGLVIDQGTRRIYWSQATNPAGSNTGIYYASLDSVSPTQTAVVTGSQVGSPRGLVLDLTNSLVYWTDSTSGQTVSGPRSSIDFAPLTNPSNTLSKFTISGSYGLSGNQLGTNAPLTVAVDPVVNRLYWANSAGLTSVSSGWSPDDPARRVRYADLTGAPPATAVSGNYFDISPLAGGGLRGLVVDKAAGRIYFATPTNTNLATIDYANLDGTGAGAHLPTGDAWTTSAESSVILRKPEASAAPQLTGTAAIGSELTCGDATWAADAVNLLVYRMAKTTAFGGWTKDGSPIADANATTYSPTAAGEYRCLRTATNWAGTTTAQSNAVIVAAPPTETTPSTTTTTTTPSSTPASLAIAATGAAISTAGVVAVPATCSGAACAGTLSLVAAGTTIGSGAVSLAAGQTGTVAVLLNATGQKAARKQARIATVATVALTGQVPATTAFTLTAARAPALLPLTRSAKESDGRVRVRLRCVAATGSVCRGTLTLTAKLGRKTQTIARRNVSVQGGKTVSVSPLLTKAARKQLADRDLIATQKTVTSIDVGRATASRARLRIRAS